MYKEKLKRKADIECCIMVLIFKPLYIREKIDFIKIM